MLNRDCAQVLDGRLDFVEYIEGMKNYKRKKNEHFGGRICSISKVVWRSLDWIRGREA